MEGEVDTAHALHHGVYCFFLLFCLPSTTHYFMQCLCSNTLKVSETKELFSFTEKYNNSFMFDEKKQATRLPAFSPPEGAGQGLVH